MRVHIWFGYFRCFSEIYKKKRKEKKDEEFENFYLCISRKFREYVVSKIIRSFQIQGKEWIYIAVARLDIYQNSNRQPPSNVSSSHSIMLCLTAAAHVIHSTLISLWQPVKHLYDAAFKMGVRCWLSVFIKLVYVSVNPVYSLVQRSI